MGIEITVPAWEDASIEEGFLANWFARPGAAVRQGQSLGELMVEKSTIELVAPQDGVIQEVRLQRGDVVKPGMVVAVLAEAAGATPVSEAASAATPAPVAAASGAFIPASPAARRLARELGVALERVTPADGRHITEDDIRRATTATTATPATPTAAEAGADGGEALSGRRKVIAERMLRSVQTSAQLTLTTDARADALVAARERAAQRFDVTYTDLLAWVAIQALKQHPAMNATLVGDRLRRHDEIHIGLAVAVPDGLLVPVIRDAGALSLEQLAERAREGAERARSNTSAPGELSGGTFSLTTLGAYEIDAFTPILNPPEVGILGIGRIREAIVPQDGQPAFGHMIALSLTFDHRAVDGAPAADFLRTIKHLIESAATFSEAG